MRFETVFSHTATIVALATVLGHLPGLSSHPVNDSVLSVPIPSFQIENATMEQALRVLRTADPVRILIGFEKVAHSPDEKEKVISLSLSNATVGEILSALCRVDSRYTYEVTGTSILHVYPQHSSSDPPGLLNLRIATFSVQGKMAPAAVIHRIGELAPELSSFLRSKREEYYASRGISPGSPGASMTGSMDPQIELHLQNKTVREILDQVVLYSLQLNKEMPPDRTGNKIPPTSWIYEFTIDPAAPTGLGGTPRWAAF